MSCSNCSRLCDRLRITTAVNIVGGNVVYNLPAGGYNSNECYCIVLAQNVPATATIGANIFFSIGGTATQYPFLSCDCKPLTSCAVRGRRRYKVRVETTQTSGVFKMLGKACPCPTNNLPSINGTAPAVVDASAFAEVNAVSAQAKTSGKKEA